MTKRGAKPALTIIDAMTSPALFGDFYTGDSWNTWKAVLKAMFALPMTADDIALFKSVSGGREPSPQRAKKVVLAIARRGGKDAIVALMAAWAAMSFKPNGRVRAGERPLILLLAADRAQSRNLLRYIRALFDVPALKALITRETQDGFELANGLDVYVGTADWRSVRGRSILFCAMNELSFWRDETSSNPDREIYRAVVPGTATLGDDAMIVMISSVHRRTGLLYEEWSKGFGKGDPTTLVVMGGTRQFNPTIDQQLIDDAIADDPAAASAEYLSVWRDDLAGYVTRTEIEAVVVKGADRRAPQPGLSYVAWIDASSGSGADSMCAAIGHREGENQLIVDCVVEIKPPFVPTEAVAQLGAALRSYSVSRATGDRWGLGFVASEFERNGITLEYGTRNSSETFREALPIIRSKRCRLPDNSRMMTQFCNLERRTLSGGAEKIGHPERGGHHDDLALVVAGCLVALASPVGSPEGWLEFLRWQVEGVPPGRGGRNLPSYVDVDDVRPSVDHGWNFAVEPLLSLFVPPAIATAGRVGDRAISRYLEGRAIVEMTAGEARQWLKSSTWAALNPELVERFMTEDNNNV